MSEAQPPKVPDPAPMPVNLFRLLLFGTVLWAITAIILALLALLAPNLSLGLWPWIALAGTILGGAGMIWSHVNRDQIQQFDDELT